MENDIWKEQNILAVCESIIYKCELEEDEMKILLLLTNYRIVLVLKTVAMDEYFEASLLLRSIIQYGIGVDYENCAQSNNDYGKGKYFVGFGVIGGENYTLRFYSEKVQKSFYEE